MGYRLVILSHLVGVFAFLGTFVAAWLAYACARRTRSATRVAALYELVNAGDRWLTPMSVVVILVSGFLAASLRGLSVTGTGWILWSLIAFGVSGIVFVTRLSGLQRWLATSAESRREVGGDVAHAYRLALTSWARWATIGTAAVLIALGLMVLQPSLPGF